jgi:sigma-B regulation protein RsbU (phosphoserine phosphatase)
MIETNKKILVVDDEEVIRKIISFNLKRKGYEPILADSAFAAIDLLRQNKVQLVLCDVNMAGMSGLAFCEKVREQEEYKALPFIFITGKDSPESRTEAFSIGADDYVTKPFNIDGLMLKIEALLKRVEIYRSYGLRDKLSAAPPEIGKRVIVVDDDPFFAGMIKTSFENAGFEVREAYDAKSGFELAMSFSPDIILSDISMPDIDGYQFRQNLLADPRVRDIPFVFLTAADSEQVIIDSYKYEIKDFIVKTTRPQVLVAKVANIIKTTRNDLRKGLQELRAAVDKVGMDVAPSQSPRFKGFTIRQWHVPYRDTPGGDFIDYIELDDSRMVIILGDVMGKKWGAWFFAFSFIGYIRSAIRVVVQKSSSCSAGDVLNEVNKAIYKDAKISEIFSSVSIVIVDNRNSTFQYAGAGDMPLLLFDRNKKTVKKLSSEDPLLGIIPGTEYHTNEITLSKDESLLFFTDGITDSRNSNGMPLTYDGVYDAVLAARPEDPFAYLKNHLIEFTKNRFDDDVSLLSVELQ